MHVQYMYYTCTCTSSLFKCPRVLCCCRSDRAELLGSLQDLRQENRRLTEKERKLQASLDLSEEQLRAMQSENTLLSQQLSRLLCIM